MPIDIFQIGAHFVVRSHIFNASVNWITSLSAVSPRVTGLGVSLYVLGHNLIMDYTFNNFQRPRTTCK